MPLGQHRPFRRLGQHIQLRRQQDVGQAQGLAGEIGLLSQQARQLGHHLVALGHGRLDGRQVGLLTHQGRFDQALEADHIVDALKQVPVVDVHQLIHPRGGARIARSQGQARRHPVDIAQDGLGLVEREAVVLQGRHACEGVARDIGLLAMIAGLQPLQAPGRALFLKGDQGSAAKGAAGNEVQDKRRHGVFLSWRRHIRRNYPGDMANRR